jgi:hypothetical protein
MTRYALDTTIDATYSDSGTDASVKIHQALHDTEDAFINNFDDALGAASDRQVLMWDATLGYTPRSLLSTDNPAVVTNSQSGTSYTLVLGDAGKVVELTNGSAVTLTVPPNSSVAFPTGTVIAGRQYGAGQVTITPGSGVTLRSRGAALKTAGTYAEFAMTKRGTDEWVISGDVTT